MFKTTFEYLENSLKSKSKTAIPEYSCVPPKNLNLASNIQCLMVSLKFDDVSDHDLLMVCNNFRVIYNGAESNPFLTSLFGNTKKKSNFKPNKAFLSDIPDFSEVLEVQAYPQVSSNVLRDVYDFRYKN